LTKVFQYKDFPDKDYDLGNYVVVNGILYMKTKTQWCQTTIDKAFLSTHFIVESFDTEEYELD
jgi:hypothetical protein